MRFLAVLFLLALSPVAVRAEEQTTETITIPYDLVTTETLAQNVTAIVLDVQAASLRSGTPVSHQEAAKVVYFEMAQQIVAARQGGLIGDGPAVQCTQMLANAVSQSLTAENTFGLWQAITRAIALGTWEDLGAFPGVLPPPSPELRAGLESLLIGYVRGKREAMRLETPIPVESQ